jgi:transcriptional regulator with XRE-family HTH domain
MNNQPAIRETEIGKRLRMFREHLKIARTAFALEIGIGSERLASYENGRTPLRYEVFSKITNRFHLSPFWLATGQTPPEMDGPLEDSEIGSDLRPRMLFSEAYDAILKKWGTPTALQIGQKLDALQRRSQEIKEIIPLDVAWMPLRRELAKIQKAIGEARASVKMELPWKQPKKVR